MSTMTMTETLRKAVRTSGQSMYAIAAAAGLTRPSLSRFMAETQSLRLDMADKLAAYLGLELRPAARRRKGR
jgi:plasmid maintenance system antidote protein VapI